jgi:hypothetical protein
MLVMNWMRVLRDVNNVPSVIKRNLAVITFALIVILVVSLIRQEQAVMIVHLELIAHLLIIRRVFHVPRFRHAQKLNLLAMLDTARVKIWTHVLPVIWELSLVLII